MLIVFIISLTVFASIGIASLRKRKKHTKDYLLAGQQMQPWLVALSAVATNSSGYMFIGLIGYTYTVGLQSIWLMLGWVIGDFIGSWAVTKRLRTISYKHQLLSFGSILAFHKKTMSRSVQLVSGIMSFLFLITYASAQFTAGSKALEALLGWDNTIGILLSAIIVLLYCFSGGIRASIWTDAAQSIVMVVAMLIMLIVGINAVGGLEASWQQLHAVSPTYLNWFGESQSTWWSAGLFIMGWIAAGFGVIGQPHIMVRYMTLDKPEKINVVRFFYYTAFGLFFAIAVGVGLLSHLVIQQSSGTFDPEFALPQMALTLLPDAIVGIILAGIFSATISTADSLIISCTATCSNDIFPKLKHHYNANKRFTVLITCLAMLLSLQAVANVFVIVTYSWAMLGAAFGPIILLKSIHRQVPPSVCLLMIICGSLACISWTCLGYSSLNYEIFPGLLTGFLIYAVYAVTKHPEKTLSQTIA